VVTQVDRHPAQRVLAEGERDDHGRDGVVDDEEHDRGSEGSPDLTRSKLAGVFEETAPGQRGVCETRGDEGDDVLALVEDDPTQILALANVVQQGGDRLCADCGDERPRQHERQAERA